ncbi:MAG: flagellar export chaperone FliS [Thiobacillaceae bacterium]
MYTKLMENATAYSQVGLETGVLSASPHKLISMLLEGAMSSISAARKQMVAGEIEAKSNSITKAMNIIGEGLKGSLDLRKGGEIAIQLYSLYSYLSGRLFLANLRNQPELLDEVTTLLGQIHEAWSQISPADKSRDQQPGNTTISIAA